MYVYFNAGKYYNFSSYRFLSEEFHVSFLFHQHPAYTFHSQLKTDNSTAEIKPQASYTVSVDGVSSPTKVELGKRVTIDFIWNLNMSDFHLDLCTAKGNNNELVLI